MLYKLEDLKAEWLKNKRRVLVLDPVQYPGWEKLEPGDGLKIDDEWLTVKTVSDNWQTAGQSPRVRIEFEQFEERDSEPDHRVGPLSDYEAHYPDRVRLVWDRKTLVGVYGSKHAAAQHLSQLGKHGKISENRLEDYDPTKVVFPCPHLKRTP